MGITREVLDGVLNAVAGAECSGSSLRLCCVVIIAIFLVGWALSSWRRHSQNSDRRKAYRRMEKLWLARMNANVRGRMRGKMRAGDSSAFRESRESQGKDGTALYMR